MYGVGLELMAVYEGKPPPSSLEPEVPPTSPSRSQPTRPPRLSEGFPPHLRIGLGVEVCVLSEGRRKKRVGLPRTLSTGSCVTYGRPRGGSGAVWVLEKGHMWWFLPPTLVFDFATFDAGVTCQAVHPTPLPL